MAERTLEEDFREYLETLPIQTLRILGRKFGSLAESRKTKRECIEGILDILMRRTEPAPVSKKGAPVKQNYLDPSIIARLEQIRLAWEREEWKSTPLNTLTVHSPYQPKSFFDQTVHKGILELTPGGYGFLRAKNCQPSDEDIFVAAPFLQSLNLREGDVVCCTARDRIENEPLAFGQLLSVNTVPYSDRKPRPEFEKLTPCYPERRIPLSGRKGELSLRLIDAFIPIGMGQRALILSPPKSGKTTLLKELAVSLERMQPDVHLIALLIDERPEEVTEFRRALSDAEVVSTTFDEDAIHHVRAAKLCIAHAKRFAEHGRNVVLLLDSLNRLTRAYAQVTEPSGKTLSGGLDTAAFQEAKRFFGAARNTVEAGSITIIASLCVDTGSRTDDAICEEFKGTGNSEIVLSRTLAKKHCFPAIDLKSSGTRREELLLPEEELSLVQTFRERHAAEDTGAVLTLMKKTKDNREFFSKLKDNLQSARKTKETK